MLVYEKKTKIKISKKYNKFCILLCHRHFVFSKKKKINKYFQNQLIKLKI